MLVLPEILPDETLFSLCARIHRLSGFTNISVTSNLLFRSGRLLTHHDIPFGLDAFAEQTNSFYGDGASVLATATVIPYFMRFMSQERRKLIETLARSNEASRLKFFLGMIASRTRASLPLSLCPNCLKADTEAFGFAHWRRTHQLPGTFVCVHHGDPLMRASSNEGWKRLRSPVLPSDSYLPVAAACSLDQERARERLLSLASVARSLLGYDRATAFDPEVLKHTYRQALKDRGLLTMTGNIKIALYLNCVRSHFSAISDIDQLQPFFEGRWIRGFLKPLRSHETVVGSPLLHSLMIDLLWGSWDDFIAAYQWQRALTREPAPARVPPQLSVDDIAKRDSLRQRIAALLCRQGSPSRRQVASALGWDFKWLQIYDGEWLRSALPAGAPTRAKGARGNYQVDWIERDRALSLRLKENAHYVGSFGGRQQITRQTVVDRLGGTGFVIRWERLPLSRQAADELVHKLKDRSA